MSEIDFSMKLPHTTVAFIYFFAKQQWVKFSLLILSFIVWAASDALFPYFLKRIVNTIQDFHGDRATIYSLIGGTLALLVSFWVLAEIFMRFQGVLQIYTLPRFQAAIRAAVFDYVSGHSYDYFSRQFSGTMAKKLSDLATSCANLMDMVCFQFVTASTGAVLVLIMMWQTNPLFAAILAAWLTIHLSIIFLFLRYGNRLAEIHAESLSTLSGKVVDVFSNMLNVRLFARRRYEAAYLQQFQMDEMAKCKQSLWLVEIMRIALGINGLGMIFAMVFGLLHGWIHHWVTVGDFTQVMMQAFWLLGWLWFLSFQISVIAREKGLIDNALDLLRVDYGIVDHPEAKPLLVKGGEIRFEQVCFSYKPDIPVFKALSLTIPAGQKIGLVGFSGSGKSTFINLLLRFYDLNSGCILVDGQNIAFVQQDSLREQIAMIPQDPALLHRSLLENIRYGRLDASDAEVIEAAQLAHCHEFIEKQEGGYQALVGERGVKLSGGQRQRIAIARAMLKNAPILVLDEATSALDSVTEQLIQESLQQLMAHKTTIVVAHRLSTLADMDRIIVFYQGDIIEDGTHQDLLAKNGHFATLWQMQRNGFLPDEGEDNDD